MRLSRSVIVVLLGVLYALCVAVRLVDTAPRTPYFKGASAMHYRHALAVANGARLDAADLKANFPDGYEPATYGTTGVEWFAGHAYRIARFFSEADARPFFSALFVLVFALCVPGMYLLVRRLWDCQAGGLIAAGVVALFAPLSGVTDGTSLAHTPFAVVLVLLHAMLLLRVRRDGSVWAGVWAAVVAFLIAASWEVGLYYIAAVTVTLSLLPGGHEPATRWNALAHAAAALAVCLAEPYLRGLRAACAWPVILLVANASAHFFHGRIGSRLRRAGFVFGTAAVVTLVLLPVRAGASASVPVGGYVWYRLRYLFGHPAPGLLPAAVRDLWSGDHAPPSPYQLLSMFLPLAFFIAAALAGAPGHVRRRPLAFAAAAIAAGLGAFVYAVDRGTLVPAVLAMLPLAGLAGRGLSAAAPTRGPLVALGAYLVVAEAAFPLGAANPVFQIGKGGGFAHRDPARFLWASTENTERQLVGFVAQRTPVRDAFLGTEPITALLLAFSGRTSVPIAGAVLDTQAARNAGMMNMVYMDEDSLYRSCHDMGVSYVLYSIDMVLDTTPYSPAYLAGVTNVSHESTAWRMHFSPETLEHFTLIYENDHYRLFHVTEKPEAVFLTDHPPVYQLDAFERAGGDVDAFRQRALDLLLTYRQAMQARAQGNTEAALRQLGWCIEQAPHYTDARIAVGSTLIRAGRLEEARDVLLGVIAYAPDNGSALYYTAYVLAALGETDRAGQYIDLLLSTTTDPQLLSRARLLKTFIDQGIAVTPRSLPE